MLWCLHSHLGTHTGTVPSVRIWVRCTICSAHDANAFPLSFPLLFRLPSSGFFRISFITLCCRRGCIRSHLPASIIGQKEKTTLAHTQGHTQAGCVFSAHLLGRSDGEHLLTERDQALDGLNVSSLRLIVQNICRVTTIRQLIC